MELEEEELREAEYVFIFGESDLLSFASEQAA